jgi:hypothetical protein
MIPHAISSASRAQCALVVPVILPPLIASAVATASDPGGPAPTLAPATGAAVHVSTIAPSVHPELATAMATGACSDLQSTSTRSKNWTPPPSGRILSGYYVTEVCGALALPPKGSER